jgi:hypothetical protein
VQPDPKNLRVSDAEREHVVALLQNAVGRGMLDLTEFTERSDTALAARTRGELNAVLVDLPGLIHSEAAVPTPVVAPPSAALTVRADRGVTSRRGRWSVPAVIDVHCHMGKTTLDFTRAQFEQTGVAVRLDVRAGLVELRVPAGSWVSADEVAVLGGAVRHHGHARPGHGDSPRIEVTGQIQGGMLSIKHLRRGLFG